MGKQVILLMFTYSRYWAVVSGLSALPMSQLEDPPLYEKGLTIEVLYTDLIFWS